MWERLARDFPEHLNGGTLRWIPKSLARRYAAVRLQVLDWSMDAEAAKPPLPASRVAAWSRLSQIIPFLILHEDLREDLTVGGGVRTQTPLRKELVRRLRLAEQGRFADLLREAAEYERAATVRASEAPLRARTKVECQQAASEKAEDGCLRTAAQLLTGEAVLPRTSAMSEKSRVSTG